MTTVRIALLLAALILFALAALAPLLRVPDTPWRLSVVAAGLACWVAGELFG